MKKIIAAILMITLCLTALISCRKAGHSHENCEWVINALGHYQNCETENKKINEGEHTIDAEHICTVCKAEVVAFSPKSLEITTFNEFGFTETYTRYYDGNEVYRKNTVFEKDGSTYTGYKIYLDKTLIEEGTFVKNGENSYRVTKDTEYLDDGFYGINTYDEHENITKYTEYDKNGKVYTESIYENTYSESGVLIRQKRFKNDVLSRDRVFDENGARISTKYYYEDGESYTVTYDKKGNNLTEIYYNADGSVDYEYSHEYSYDKDGNLIHEKVYRDSVLCEELQYLPVTYKYAAQTTYVAKETEYNDDVTIVYTCDEYGDDISVAHYDSDGELLSLQITETSYDKYGRTICEKTYEDDALVYVYECSYLNDDIYADSRTKHTYYYGDMTQVYEYDEHGYTASRIEYDADGKVIYSRTYENKYDDNGEMLSRKIYEDDVLTSEEEYSYYSDDPYVTYRSKEIYYREDSSKCIYIYNELDDTVSKTEYDPDGNILCTYTYEYTYDDKDLLLLVKVFEDGVLDYEDEYSYYSDDPYDTYHSKRIEYYEDSSKSITGYDEDGHIISGIRYDQNGEIVYSQTYDKEYDDNGNLLSYKIYEDGVLTSEREYSYYSDDPDDTYLSKEIYYDGLSKNVIIYNEEGDTISDIQYDENGNEEYSLRYEYEYDDNGETLFQKTYEDDVLTSEEEYSYYSNDPHDTYCSKRTYYREDSSKEISTYNELGDVTSDIRYDADGNVIYNYTYKLEYDANGEIIKVKIFSGDVLVAEEEYSYRPNDPERTYFSKKTEYYEDSSKRIITYDEHGSITADVMYDESGKVSHSYSYESTYDDDGYRLFRKTYSNGRLLYENEFSYFSNGRSGTYVSKEIYYLEGGGKRITTYSEDYQVISTTTYDKDGNIV